MVDRKMPRAGSGSRDTTVGVLGVLLFLLLLPDFIHSFSYPIYTMKPVGKPATFFIPSFVPMPIASAAASRKYVEFPPTDYEDVYVPLAFQDEADYPTFNRYPVASFYGYYPYVDDRKYGYVNDGPVSDSVDLQGETMRDDLRDDATYGRETWFKEDKPSFDVNSEANSAFLQNLMKAQMYEDAVNAEETPQSTASFPFSYGVGSQILSSPLDEEDDRRWSYGIPVTEVKEDSREKNEGDESVKELESLREPEKLSKSKSGKPSKAKIQKSKLRKEDGSPSSKEEILRELQKQFGRNTRRVLTPAADEFKVQKEEMYNSQETSHKPRSLDEKGNFDSGKSSSLSDGKIKGQFLTTVSAPTGEPESVSTASAKHGQKEYVLPRPANPVRRFYDRETSIRRDSKPSVYETIKKLLKMDDKLRQESGRIRKRYVMNDDQLTTELSGLKRIAV